MGGHLIKVALRSLARRKWTTIICIVSLSLGLSAAMLIGCWVENELSFDSFHPGAGRIYQILIHKDKADRSSGDFEATPFLLGEVAKKTIPGVEQIARVCDFTQNPPVFQVKQELYSEPYAAYVDENWLKVFHYDLIEGNFAAFDSDPYGLVLTASKAKEYFGKGRAVGQVVRSDNKDFTVRAVVADNPANSSFPFDVLRSVRAYMADPQRREVELNWNVFNYVTFIRVSDHSDLGAVTRQLNEILNRNCPARTGMIIGDCLLSPIKEMHFRPMEFTSFVHHGDRMLVYLFSISALVLLVAACINTVNLTIAGTQLQTKEVSIRRIAGAGYGSLLARFLTESLLIEFAAVLLALLICWIGLPFFNSLTGNDVSIGILTRVVWQGLTGLLLVTLLVGLYPAMLLARFSPLEIFRGVSILNLRDTQIRKGLLWLQFCIAMGLMASSGIILSQMRYIRNHGLSYDKSSILHFSLPFSYFLDHTAESRADLTEAIRRRLLTCPAIEKVSVAGRSIVNISAAAFHQIDWDGKPAGYDPVIAMLSADSSYIQLFGLTLTEGRWWFREKSDSPSHGEYVLNETAVKELKIRKPVVGQWFVLGQDTGRITGIVKDFYYNDLRHKIAPLIMYDRPGWKLNIFARVQAGKSAEALEAVRAAWKEFIPDHPLEYSFLDQEYHRLYVAEDRTTRLSLCFSVVSLVLSIMGLLGMASVTAGQRVKEIGVRRVLGARFSQVLWLLAADFVRLFLLAQLVAIPAVVIGMSGWLREFAYRTPINPVEFVVPAVFILGVIAVVLLYVTVRVSRTNPVSSLRSE